MSGYSGSSLVGWALSWVSFEYLFMSWALLWNIFIRHLERNVPSFIAWLLGPKRTWRQRVKGFYSSFQKKEPFPGDFLVARKNRSLFHYVDKVLVLSALQVWWCWPNEVRDVSWPSPYIFSVLLSTIDKKDPPYCPNPFLNFIWSLENKI